MIPKAIDADDDDGDDSSDEDSDEVNCQRHARSSSIPATFLLQQAHCEVCVTSELKQFSAGLHFLDNTSQVLILALL